MALKQVLVPNLLVHLKIIGQINLLEIIGLQVDLPEMIDLMDNQIGVKDLIGAKTRTNPELLVKKLQANPELLAVNQQVNPELLAANPELPVVNQQVNPELLAANPQANPNLELLVANQQANLIHLPDRDHLVDPDHQPNNKF
jgi:hypothetical protein